MVDTLVPSVQGFNNSLDLEARGLGSIAITIGVTQKRPFRHPLSQ